MRSKRRSLKSKSSKEQSRDRLWAPWRIGYIRQNKRRKGGCIFCDAFSGKKSGQLVFKSRHALAMLNIYPYNNGHLMVAPSRHVSDISALNEREFLDLIRGLLKAQSMLKKHLAPEGFNIGLNIGKAAGAGITDHIHIHIVPRWVGDTNFMPALGAGKIISQSLEELLKLLTS